jgi:hypothetical protein
MRKAGVYAVLTREPVQDTSEACARHIRGLCKTHQRPVQDTSEACARHIRGLCKCLCRVRQGSKQSPTMGHLQGRGCARHIRGLCMTSPRAETVVMQGTHRLWHKKGWYTGCVHGTVQEMLPHTALQVAALCTCVALPQKAGMQQQRQHAV